MRIHRIRGRSLHEALWRARREHGEEAVVVAQEPEEGGAVTLVVTRPTPRAEARARQSEAASSTASASAPARAADAPPATLPAPSELFEREVGRRLREHGASEAFVRRVADAVEALRAEPARADRHPIDLAAEALEAFFPRAHAPRLRGATRTIALVGAPGSGKSTALGKLALRMARAGRRIALATLDTRRIASVESLRATARLCNVPFFPLHGAPDYARRDLRDGGFEALLVDTTGRARFDRVALARLAASLGPRSAGRSDVLLVLPATASRAALARAASAHAALAPSACVLTRLDESAEPAAALEAALEAQLPPAFLCAGPRLASGLWRAEGARLADLVLRRRLA